MVCTKYNLLLVYHKIQSIVPTEMSVWKGMAKVSGSQITDEEISRWRLLNRRSYEFHCVFLTPMKSKGKTVHFMTHFTSLKDCSLK